jgi:hypothetical protein
MSKTKQYLQDARVNAVIELGMRLSEVSQVKRFSFTPTHLKVFVYEGNQGIEHEIETQWEDEAVLEELTNIAEDAATLHPDSIETTMYWSANHISIVKRLTEEEAVELIYPWSV